MCDSFTSGENLHAGIVCSALRKIALGMLSTSAALISGRVKTEAQRREQMIAGCHIAVRDRTADLTRAIDRTTAANSIKPATRLVPPITPPIWNRIARFDSACRQVGSCAATQASMRRIRPEQVAFCGCSESIRDPSNFAAIRNFQKIEL